MYSTFPAHTQIAPLLPNSSCKLPLAANPQFQKPKTQDPRTDPKTDAKISARREF